MPNLVQQILCKGEKEKDVACKPRNPSPSLLFYFKLAHVPTYTYYLLAHCYAIWLLEFQSILGYQILFQRTLAASDFYRHLGHQEM